jgi:hypothetical protein
MARASGIDARIECTPGPSETVAATTESATRTSVMAFCTNVPESTVSVLPSHAVHCAEDFANKASASAAEGKETTLSSTSSAFTEGPSCRPNSPAMFFTSADWGGLVGALLSRRELAVIHRGEFWVRSPIGDDRAVHPGRAGAARPTTRREPGRSSSCGRRNSMSRCTSKQKLGNGSLVLEEVVARYCLLARGSMTR